MYVNWNKQPSAFECTPFWFVLYSHVFGALLLSFILHPINGT